MKKLFISSLFVGLAAVLFMFWPKEQPAQSPNFANTPAPSIRAEIDPVCLGVQAFERKSWDVAYRELSAGARKGNPVAQYYLGMMFVRGLGVKQDPRKGMRWLFRAAEQRFPNALFELGMLSYRGVVLGRNYSEAFSWFEQAAMLSHAEAQYFLGSMYLSGRGTQEDSVAGHAWLSVAFENGFEPASDALARSAASSSEAKKVQAELQNVIAQTIKTTTIPRAPQCTQ